MEVTCGEDSVVFKALDPFQWAAEYSTVAQTFTHGEAVLEPVTLEGCSLLFCSGLHGPWLPWLEGAGSPGGQSDLGVPLPVLPPPPRFLLHSRARALGREVNGNLERVGWEIAVTLFLSFCCRCPLSTSRHQARARAHNFEVLLTFLGENFIAFG